MTTRSRSDSPPFRVLIVDDHPVMRLGLASTLRQASGLEPCGEAQNAEEALELCERLQPDLLLVDVSLDGGSGFALIRTARERWPDLPILVLSVHDERLFADRALRAGAQGYVGKEEGADVLVAAMRRVLDGEVYLSPRLAERRELLRYEGRTDDPLAELSDRELEVFSLLGQGLSSRQIAERLHISPKTVEAHREGLKRKLGIGSGTELVRRAVAETLRLGAVVEDE